MAPMLIPRTGFHVSLRVDGLLFFCCTAMERS